VALKILIATTNSAKVAEYLRLLAGIPLELTTPVLENVIHHPEETGSTFEENALLKARFYSRTTGLVALADDSGLEVDALGGSPGVRSARFGGGDATDQDRSRLVLMELEGVPQAQRSARFRCVIALVWPNGRQETFDGTSEGYIASRPSGDAGFGYDPIFYYPELGKTFGEVDPDVKDRHSHRGKAARKVLQRLKEAASAASKT
jgi:XTP/dITP diphosphohydrolase